MVYEKLIAMDIISLWLDKGMMIQITIKNSLIRDFMNRILVHRLFL